MRRKTTPKKRLINKLDKTWYLKYLKKRCEVCNSKDVLQGHHFYYKGFYSNLRWDKDNHITLCRGCHFVLHHQDPKKIENQIIEKRGKRWHNRLTKKSKEPIKQFNMSYLKEIEKQLNT